MKAKLNKIKEWVAIDGLLHFLVCYCGMVAFFPFIRWWNILLVVFCALLKEVCDFYIKKDNDIKAVVHDLIMDAVGIVSAMATLLIL